MDTQSSNTKKENEKAMILVIGDLHSGSRTAVINPKSKLEGNISVPCSKRQAQIYGKMNNGIDYEKQYADIHNIKNRLVLVTGDLLDGIHHDTTEIVSRDRDDMVTLAQDVLINCKRFDDKFLFVKGTSAHTGQNSELEKLVAKEFGAIKNNDGERVWEKVQFEINGTFFDVAHHTKTGQSKDGFYAPLIKNLNRVEEDNPGKKRYVVIRSHIHKYSSITLENTKTHITTPSLQMATNYIYSFNPNTRGFSMGILGIVVNEDGSITQLPYLFDIEEDHFAKKVF
ncbi:MAG: hypothetical protein KG029_00650 [Bacteroidetes bacterium]|nr:hypothetical protein [Bacteroidota bacterium]